MAETMQQKGNGTRTVLVISMISQNVLMYDKVILSVCLYTQSKPYSISNNTILQLRVSIW